MDEFRRKTDRLLDEPWLTDDVGRIEDVARRITARRRRTMAVGVAAFAVVVAISGGAVALARPSGRSSELTAAQRQAFDCAAVIRSGISPQSIQVTMQVSASPGEIESVRAEMARTPGLQDVVVHDRGENADLFRDLFSTAPESAAMAEMVGPSVTASADGDLSSEDLDRIVGDLADRSGVVDASRGDQPCEISDPDMHRLVDGFQRGRWKGGIDAMIYLDPAITPARQDAVLQLLKDDPAVIHITYVSQEVSLTEFRCLFAGSPEMLETVTADVLPPSYRIDLADDVDRRVIDLRDQLTPVPGFKEIAAAPSLDELLALRPVTPSEFQQLSTISSVECPTIGEPIK